MDKRYSELKHWLDHINVLPSFSLQPMTGDASFRRYFRVQHKNLSYVAMDAPPGRGENCVPFIAIAHALREQKLITPKIIASDLTQGFILMTDFGDKRLIQALEANNAEALYKKALDALNILQGCKQVPGWKVPFFTKEFMYQELILFKEWFLQNYLRLVLPATTEKQLTDYFWFVSEMAAAQPQVFMHRDYHSANLMLLDNQQIGILDFQDAFVGPVLYDVVSLLRDCYVAWPGPLIQTLVCYYHEQLALTHISHELFLNWFDWMGVQRHLKALLTFSRKFLRDQDSHYLQYVPRTLHYIETVSERYREGQFFYHFLCDQILPAYQQVTTLCAQ